MVTEAEFYLSLLSAKDREMYRKTWASFQKYGTEGPPIGLKVVTIRAGFGGLGGEQRTIADRDETYFWLNGGGRQGLSRIESWWHDFYVLEAT